MKSLIAVVTLAIALQLSGCATYGGTAAKPTMSPVGDPSMNQPVNLVKYSAIFTSAGQPGSVYIRTLAAQDVEIVINIAPPTAHGALEDEARLVSAVGMTYLNIPVDWNRPTQMQFDQFLDFMQGNAGRKVFLHCQMNMRASAYAFLHRVINLDIPPDIALADLQAVWTPNPTWAAFMNKALQRHDIAFEVPSQ